MILKKTKKNIQFLSMLHKMKNYSRFEVAIYAKYGIKIFALVDSISYYTSNLEIFSGVQFDGPFSIDN